MGRLDVDKEVESVTITWLSYKQRCEDSLEEERNGVVE